MRHWFSGRDSGGPLESSCVVGAVLVASLMLFFIAFVGLARAAIYWGNGTPIARANLDGTQAEFNFIPEPPPLGGEYIGCGGVAVGASHVFWADPLRDTIGRANLDGTEPIYAFITGAGNPCGVAVDGTHVFWANFTGNSIGRANIDGTEPTQTFVNAVNKPCGVAVDGKFVYWTSAELNYVGRALLQGGIRGPNLIEGDSAGADFCGVAVNETHVFWGGFGEAIGRANLNGSDPDPSFITGVERPCGVAVDGAHIYWTEQSFSSPLIGSANLDGTGVTRSIPAPYHYPCGIAVDGLALTPAGSLPSSHFTFGKVKHSKRKWAAFIAVNIPDQGFFRVNAPGGVRWTLLPEGTTGNSVSGGRRWLKVWPAGKGRGGQHLRRQIRRTGKVRIVIAVHYAEAGKSPINKRKGLSLIGR